MADIKQTLLASAFLCLLSGTVFAGVNVTSLEAGYKAYPSATKQKNKGAWDQSVLNSSIWGLLIGAAILSKSSWRTPDS